MKFFFQAFVRNKSGLVGVVLMLLIILLALTSQLIFPHDVWDMVGAPYQEPFSTEGELWLGTDSLGRDIAAGIAHGARASLLLACVAAGLGLLLGVSLGAIAGYFGGMVDQIVVGVIEIFQTIPAFFLAVVLVAILTPSLVTVTLSIAVVSWTTIARLVRAEFMSLKKREFVEAAVLSGQKSWQIIVIQILPNSLSPVIVSGSLMVASAILLESALSFLGLGDPNTMTWGYMIGASRTYLRDAWWMSVFPGVAIFLTVLSLNLIGDALTDALNPKLAKR